MIRATRRQQHKERQHGQSMVEFTVVVVFFCLAVTSDPALDAIAELTDVLKQRNTHYSYTVSLSDYPDATIFEAYKELLREQLEAQGYSATEIEEILKEKADPPEVWLQVFDQFIGDSFPDPGEFPDINPTDFF